MSLAGAVLALNSDSLKLERQKLLRAQETERHWAEVCETHQWTPLFLAVLI